ncbi:MAG: peptidylprolyl isomerase [Magnetococcales bacterium]|nr:peptidylprolyl isomerase [Magnetococcales bacterium]
MSQSRIATVLLVAALAWGIDCGSDLQAAPPAKKAAPEKPDAEKGQPLATMGDVTLTVAEFQKLLNNSDKEVRTQLLANPELMNQKIGEAVVRKYVLARAKEEKWDQKKEVAFAMERAREGVLVEHFLNGMAKSPGQYPDDSLVRQAYEENKTQIMLPPSVHVAQIFLKFEEKMDEKGRQDLTRIAEKYFAMIQKGESDFASMARKYSDHNVSATQGGDMGWVPASQLLPEFRKALEGLKDGELAGPVQTAQGLHIIQLLGSRDATPRPYDQVKGTLAQMLKGKKLQENKDNYLIDLVKKDPISLNEANRTLLK